MPLVGVVALAGCDSLWKGPLRRALPLSAASRSCSSLRVVGAQHLGGAGDRVAGRRAVARTRGVSDRAEPDVAAARLLGLDARALLAADRRAARRAQIRV